MSGNLLVSLSLLGLLALAAVLAYNYWQQYQLRRLWRLSQLSARQEPADGAGAVGGAGGADADLGGLDPYHQLPAHKNPALIEPLDVLIDSIITLNLPGLLYGEALLAAMPDTRRVGAKALLFEALNSTNGVWEYPVAGQQYGQMQLGVQLVQGTHRLNNIDFSEFAAAANQYAEKIHAGVELPEMRDELLRAKEIEAFVKDTDIEVALCVTSRGTPWSAGYLQQHAQRLGLVAGAYPGRMVWSQAWGPGEAPQPLFALYFDAQAALAEDLADSALRQVRLVLDVPQVPQALDPYGQMRQVAIDLAAKMDGYISDEQGRAISAEMLQGIDSSLAEIYQQLDARELAAGSALARRLFA